MVTVAVESRNFPEKSFLSQPYRCGAAGQPAAAWRPHPISSAASAASAASVAATRRRRPPPPAQWRARVAERGPSSDRGGREFEDLNALKGKTVSGESCRRYRRLRWPKYAHEATQP